MSEPTPAPAEKTVVVNPNHLCRLWTFTLASLSLNVLILVLLVVGAIIHHHHRHHHHGFGGGFGRDGGRFEGCPMAWGHGFHHFHGNFGGDGFGKGPDNSSQNPGDAPSGMPGMGGMGMGMHHMDGMPGMGGMHGMMGGAPDPAKMTDGILGFLTTKLTLTDDEKTKIKPIVQDMTTQMQQQMEAQHAAMLKQMEDTRAKIRPLLTADQQKQLDAIPLPGQKPAAADAAKPGN